MATAAVKEEPEAAPPYSLSLLLTDRNTNPPHCRTMTASSLGGHPPPPAPLTNPQNVIPRAPQSGLPSQNSSSNNSSNHNPQGNGGHQQPSCGNQQQCNNNNSSNPPPPPSSGGAVHAPPIIPQPQVNGVAAYDRVPPHSPSTMASTEVSKRNSSPNKPPANDPLSHRIIEKRRRDRMNNCLADLSRLIPTYYLKKGRGRIEKTEIIEMAIKYMKHLQAHACNQIENCDVTTKQERTGNQLEQYHMGYQECLSETMQFLVESEGFFSGDSLCVRLMNHLTKHCEKILNSKSGEGYVTRQSGASSSTSSGYHANSSSTGSSSDGNGNGSTHASEKESAYRSDERPGSDDRDEKSTSSALDSGSGMGSQLREILQQHSGPGGSVDRRSGYSSGLSSNNSSSGDDSVRMYKFKSNMKHRFSADLEQSHQVRKKRRDSESSCGNYTDCEKDRVTPTGLLPRPTSYQDGFPNESVKMLDGQDSPMLEKNSGTPSPTPKYEHPSGRISPTRHMTEGPGGTIPIFALNQNGSFYVPLTIDYSLLAPAMAGLSETSPVLHPVSIYVNFCCPTATVTANIGAAHQPNFGGPQAPHTVYPAVGIRPTYGSHNSSLHHFESSTHNGRFPSRMYNDRKRRDPPRQGVSQFEEQRTNLTNPTETIEKREPGEIDMREYRDARDHHQQQREFSRDPSACHDHGRESRDQEHMHEVREVRNLRTIRDLREARDVREIRDPVQTVRDFIDANNTCPNNSAYSRTHPHWATVYHIQSKN
ncbi:transcription factor cwo-like isoform X3 [Macrobrachium rosenbergii]|uniref:transcription factor cwo-like isoform X3 n=1 Tax=Macrobrachium rosenbergii TaxID=79674 RepID=UPI0034D64C73